MIAVKRCEKSSPQQGERTGNIVHTGGEERERKRNREKGKGDMERLRERESKGRREK